MSANNPYKTNKQQLHQTLREFRSFIYREDTFAALPPLLHTLHFGDCPCVFCRGAAEHEKLLLSINEQQKRGAVSFVPENVDETRGHRVGEGRQAYRPADRIVSLPADAAHEESERRRAALRVSPSLLQIGPLPSSLAHRLVDHENPNDERKMPIFSWSVGGRRWHQEQQDDHFLRYNTNKQSTHNVNNVIYDRPTLFEEETTEGRTERLLMVKDMKGGIGLGGVGVGEGERVWSQYVAIAFESPNNSIISVANNNVSPTMLGDGQHQHNKHSGFVIHYGGEADGRRRDFSDSSAAPTMGPLHLQQQQQSTFITVPARLAQLTEAEVLQQLRLHRQLMELFDRLARVIGEEDVLRAWETRISPPQPPSSVGSYSSPVRAANAHERQRRGAEANPFMMNVQNQTVLSGGQEQVIDGGHRTRQEERDEQRESPNMPQSPRKSVSFVEQHSHPLESPASPIPHTHSSTRPYAPTYEDEAERVDDGAEGHPPRYYENRASSLRRHASAQSVRSLAERSMHDPFGDKTGKSDRLNDLPTPLTFPRGHTYGHFDLAGNDSDSDEVNKESRRPPPQQQQQLLPVTTARSAAKLAGVLQVLWDLVSLEGQSEDADSAMEQQGFARIMPHMKRWWRETQQQAKVEIIEGTSGALDAEEASKKDHHHRHNQNQSAPTDPLVHILLPDANSGDSSLPNTNDDNADSDSEEGYKNANTRNGNSVKRGGGAQSFIVPPPMLQPLIASSAASSPLTSALHLSYVNVKLAAANLLRVLLSEASFSSASVAGEGRDRARVSSSSSSSSSVLGKIAALEAIVIVQLDSIIGALSSAAVKIIAATEEGFLNYAVTSSDHEHHSGDAGRMSARDNLIYAAAAASTPSGVYARETSRLYGAPPDHDATETAGTSEGSSTSSDDNGDENENEYGGRLNFQPTSRKIKSEKASRFANSNVPTHGFALRKKLSAFLNDVIDISYEVNNKFKTAPNTTKSNYFARGYQSLAWSIGKDEGEDVSAVLLCERDGAGVGSSSPHPSLLQHGRDSKSAVTLQTIMAASLKNAVTMLTASLSSPPPKHPLLTPMLEGKVQKAGEEENESILRERRRPQGGGEEEAADSYFGETVVSMTDVEAGTSPSFSSYPASPLLGGSRDQRPKSTARVAGSESFVKKTLAAARASSALLSGIDSSATFVFTCLTETLSYSPTASFFFAHSSPSSSSSSSSSRSLPARKWIAGESATDSVMDRRRNIANGCRHACTTVPMLLLAADGGYLDFVEVKRLLRRRVNKGRGAIGSGGGDDDGASFVVAVAPLLRSVAASSCVAMLTSVVGNASKELRCLRGTADYRGEDDEKFNIDHELGGGKDHDDVCGRGENSSIVFATPAYFVFVKIMEQIYVREQRRSLIHRYIHSGSGRKTQLPWSDVELKLLMESVPFAKASAIHLQSFLWAPVIERLLVPMLAPLQPLGVEDLLLVDKAGGRVGALLADFAASSISRRIEVTSLLTRLIILVRYADWSLGISASASAATSLLKNGGVMMNAALFSAFTSASASSSLSSLLSSVATVSSRMYQGLIAHLFGGNPSVMNLRKLVLNAASITKQSNNKRTTTSNSNSVSASQRLRSQGNGATRHPLDGLSAVVGNAVAEALQGLKGLLLSASQSSITTTRQGEARGEEEERLTLALLLDSAVSFDTKCVKPFSRLLERVGYQHAESLTLLSHLSSQSNKKEHSSDGGSEGKNKKRTGTESGRSERRLGAEESSSDMPPFFSLSCLSPFLGKGDVHSKINNASHFSSSLPPSPVLEALREEWLVPLSQAFDSVSSRLVLLLLAVERESPAFLSQLQVIIKSLRTEELIDRARRAMENLLDYEKARRKQMMASSTRGEREERENERESEHLHAFAFMSGYSEKAKAEAVLEYFLGVDDEDNDNGDEEEKEGNDTTEKGGKADSSTVAVGDAYDHAHSGGGEDRTLRDEDFLPREGRGLEDAYDNSSIMINNEDDRNQGVSDGGVEKNDDDDGRGLEYGRKKKWQRCARLRKSNILRQQERHSRTFKLSLADGTTILGNESNSSKTANIGATEGVIDLLVGRDLRLSSSAASPILNAYRRICNVLSTLSSAAVIASTTWATPMFATSRPTSEAYTDSYYYAAAMNTSSSSAKQQQYQREEHDMKMAHETRKALEAFVASLSRAMAVLFSDLMFYQRFPEDVRDDGVEEISYSIITDEFVVTGTRTDLNNAQVAAYEKIMQSRDAKQDIAISDSLLSPRHRYENPLETELEKCRKLLDKRPRLHAIVVNHKQQGEEDRRHMPLSTLSAQSVEVEEEKRGSNSSEAAAADLIPFASVTIGWAPRSEDLKRIAFGEYSSCAVVKAVVPPPSVSSSSVSASAAGPTTLIDAIHAKSGNMAPSRSRTPPAGTAGGGGGGIMPRPASYGRSLTPSTLTHRQRIAQETQREHKARAGTYNAQHPNPLPFSNPQVSETFLHDALKKGWVGPSQEQEKLAEARQASLYRMVTPAVTNGVDSCEVGSRRGGGATFFSSLRSPFVGAGALVNGQPSVALVDADYDENNFGDVGNNEGVIVRAAGGGDIVFPAAYSSLDNVGGLAFGNEEEEDSSRQGKGSHSNWLLYQFGTDDFAAQISSMMKFSDFANKGRRENEEGVESVSHWQIGLPLPPTQNFLKGYNRATAQSTTGFSSPSRSSFSASPRRRAIIRDEPQLSEPRTTTRKARSLAELAAEAEMIEAVARPSKASQYNAIEEKEEEKGLRQASLSHSLPPLPQPVVDPLRGVEWTVVAVGTLRNVGPSSSRQAARAVATASAPSGSAEGFVHSSSASLTAGASVTSVVVMEEECSSANVRAARLYSFNLVQQQQQQARKGQQQSCGDSHHQTIRPSLSAVTGRAERGVVKSAFVSSTIAAAQSASSGSRINNPLNYNNAIASEDASLFTVVSPLNRRGRGGNNRSSPTVRFVTDGRDETEGGLTARETNNETYNERSLRSPSSFSGYSSPKSAANFRSLSFSSFSAAAAGAAGPSEVTANTNRHPLSRRSSLANVTSFRFGGTKPSTAPHIFHNGEAQYEVSGKFKFTNRSVLPSSLGTRMASVMRNGRRQQNNNFSTTTAYETSRVKLRAVAFARDLVSTATRISQPHPFNGHHQGFPAALHVPSSSSSSLVAAPLLKNAGVYYDNSNNALPHPFATRCVRGSTNVTSTSFSSLVHHDEEGWGLSSSSSVVVASLNSAKNTDKTSTAPSRVIAAVTTEPSSSSVFSQWLVANFGSQSEAMAAMLPQYTTFVKERLARNNHRKEKMKRGSRRRGQPDAWVDVMSSYGYSSIYAQNNSSSYSSSQLFSTTASSRVPNIAMITKFIFSVLLGVGAHVERSLVLQGDFTGEAIVFREGGGGGGGGGTNNSSKTYSYSAPSFPNPEERRRANGVSSTPPSQGDFGEAMTREPILSSSAASTSSASSVAVLLKQLDRLRSKLSETEKERGELSKTVVKLRETEESLLAEKTNHALAIHSLQETLVKPLRDDVLRLTDENQSLRSSLSAAHAAIAQLQKDASAMATIVRKQSDMMTQLNSEAIRNSPANTPSRRRGGGGGTASLASGGVGLGGGATTRDDERNYPSLLGLSASSMNMMAAPSPLFLHQNEEELFSGGSEASTTPKQTYRYAPPTNSAAEYAAVVDNSANSMADGECALLRRVGLGGKSVDVGFGTASSSSVRMPTTAYQRDEMAEDEGADSDMSPLLRAQKKIK